MADAAKDEGGLVFHPMDQFIVKPLFGGDTIHWYTPTNVTLWMALSVLCVIALMVLATRSRSVVPGRMQSVAELAYGQEQMDRASQGTYYFSNTRIILSGQKPN